MTLHCLNRTSSDSCGVGSAQRGLSLCASNCGNGWHVCSSAVATAYGPVAASVGSPAWEVPESLRFRV